MADTKISALTAATTLADTDQLVIASAGASKSITGANLKASIPGTGGGGAWTLLSTTTIAGSAAAFDLSSISGSYNDLRLVAMLRASATTPRNDGIALTFNNDAGANYYQDWQIINGGASIPGQSTAANNFGVIAVPASSGSTPSQLYGYYEAFIPGYASTTWYKPIRILAHFTDGLAANRGNMYQVGGTWASTAAVTRIKLAVDDTPSTFVVGSQLRIYGRT